MKICFLDPAQLNYTPVTPAQAPLDGPSSALCDLARDLARSHQVTLINRARRPDQTGSVRHLQLDSLAPGFWKQEGFAAVIALDDWQALLALDTLPAQTQRICWSYAWAKPDPRLAQALTSGQLTAFVCVSHWQYRQVAEDLTGGRLVVSPPGVAPAFSQKFPNSQRLLQNKVAPLTLACSGLAGPGLDLLLRMLPNLRSRFPALRLWFLPSPQAGPEIQSVHAKLLAKASLDKRIEFKGLKGEVDLAQALRQTHVMAYPASFAESDCLAVRQALACGCRVLGPNLGALPEISRGWARLLHWSEDERESGKFWLNYFDALIGELTGWQETQMIADHLLQQSWTIASDTGSSAVAWWEDLILGPPSLSVSGRRKARPAEPVQRSLNWCFLDSSPQDYQVTSAESLPLSGPQASLCLLARQLVARGHQVSLINQTSQTGTHQGVKSLKLASLPRDFWQKQNFDLVVSDNPELLRQLPGRKVFWNPHHPDAPEVASLPQAQPEFAAVVYLSAWQQAAFQEKFGLLPGQIIPYGCSPTSRPLSEETWIEQCAAPLTMAYTSAPDRSLAILLTLFPLLRRRYPELRLKIFESEPLSQTGQPVRAIEGVEYLGAVTRPELLEALSRVHVLAYPCSDEKSFSLSALDAMTAGCLVVTSTLGALPEITSGYASLVPYSFDLMEFSGLCFDSLSAALGMWQSDPQALLPQLQLQSHFAIDTFSWQRQAVKWEELAGRLMAG